MTIKHMEICQFIVRKEFDHYINLNDVEWFNPYSAI